tara:strand:+ start:828 stop:968 length:141 start_codon:yes stop_codon:yes gene_type:complete
MNYLPIGRMALKVSLYIPLPRKAFEKKVRAFAYKNDVLYILVRRIL